MTDLRFVLGAAAGVLIAATAAAAAQPPALFAKIAPGLWELKGIAGSKVPVHQCLPDFPVLTRYEHRARNCSVSVDSDTASVAVTHYTCGASDFGRSSIRFITPRDIKVDTQGISDGLPFGYTIEARRVGECKAGGPAGSERGH